MIGVGGALVALLAAAAPAPALSSSGMAATAHPLATAAALEILDDGGNAIDAAVAATFVISVTSPFDAGLGGGGFAVVHLEPPADAPAGTAGVVEAIDFREVAPRAATRGMFLDDKGAPRPDASLNGALAVAVPGTVPGLAALHQKHGKLSWRRLLRPAIAVARDGFVVGTDFVGSFAQRQDALSRFEESRRVFTRNGKPLVPGDTLRQPDLARTLIAIARDPKAISHGAVARALAEDVLKHGGLVTLEDLSGYEPRWRTPLCAPWSGLELCTMPPPSSGGVHVIQMLNLLEGHDLRALGYNHPDTLHALIESMRIAFADRATHLGDPAFHPVPVAGLVSKAYGDKRRPEIDARRARKSADVKPGDAALLTTLGGAPPKESNDTSHLTVVDKQHNAVSLTFTVNYTFGSGMVAKGTGVLLNDEMDDFAAAPGVPNQYGLVGGEANAVAAGKIPLSSMTPLIARKDGRFALSLGSPGGSTIITTVLQMLIFVNLFGMDCQAAVGAPRVHHQWMPDATKVEVMGLDPLTSAELTARGHALKAGPGWGNAMCVRARPDGALEGGADPRGEGVAAGP